MGKLGYRNTKKLIQTAEMEKWWCGAYTPGSLALLALLGCPAVLGGATAIFRERSQITDLPSLSEGMDPSLDRREK